MAKKHPLPVVLFTIFLDLLGVGILIPVMPLLFTDTHSSFFLLSNAESLARGYIILGALSAAYPFAQFLATPILGQLSDRYGRKKILLISLVGTAIGYFIFAYGIATKNIFILFGSRILDGLTGGNIAVAQAAIADITAPHERSKNFGLIGAAFGSGFVLGPFLGGRLSDTSLVSWFSPVTPFVFAGALTLLNVISVIFFFDETRPGVASPIRIRWHQAFVNILHAVRFKTLRSLYVTSFLFNGGFAFFTTFFGVLLIKKFNFTQGDIGNFFAFIGIWIVITQALVTRLVARHFHEKAVLRWTMSMCGLLVSAYLLPTLPWHLFLIVPFFALVTGLTQSNMTGLVSRSASEDIQGEVLGIHTSVQALAQSIPPLLSGFIAAQFNPTYTIGIAAVSIIIAGIFFNLFYRPGTLVA